MNDPKEQEAWEQYSNIPSDVKGGLEWTAAERIAFTAGYYRGKQRVLGIMKVSGLLGSINRVCNLLGM